MDTGEDAAEAALREVEDTTGYRPGRVEELIEFRPLPERVDCLHVAFVGHVWEPSPDMPALVVIIDEYAELADDAPDAVRHADSIARLGRAVAVNLIAATQRPTQKAMGQGAVRSQMDIRICFRVRERKDVDLILGQGMLTAGWHAHTLNAPASS